MKRISFLKFDAAMVLIVFLIGLTTCFHQSANADMICSIGTVTGFANDSGGFDDNSSPPASFTIDLTGLGTDALAGGFLELTTFGDFSNAAEYVEIWIEGDNFGVLWDNNTSNDSFVGINTDSDIGEEYGQSFNSASNASAIAQLTESQLDTYLADGVLSITFETFGAEVNNLVRDDDEFIEAKVTVNAATTVPEPNSWLIATLVGMIGSVRRKRSS